MATLQTINAGAFANDPAADTLRTAFAKANTNDAALNAELSSLSGFVATLEDTWINLIAGGRQADVDTAITGGSVTEVTYSDRTLYRYSAADDSEDSFYTTFNGTDKPTGLVSTRYL